jgi:hypothetical protein
MPKAKTPKTTQRNNVVQLHPDRITVTLSTEASRLVQLEIADQVKWKEEHPIAAPEPKSPEALVNQTIYCTLGHHEIEIIPAVEFMQAKARQPKFPRPSIPASTTISLQIQDSLITRTLAAMKLRGHADLRHAIIEALQDYCRCEEIVVGSDGYPIGMIKHDEHGNPVGVK